MENFQEDKLELLDNINKPLLNSNDDEDKDFNYAQNPSVHIIGENDKSDEIMQSLEDVKTKNLLGECIEDILPTSDLISNPVKEDELLTNSEANLKPPQGPHEEETDAALLEEVTPAAPPSSWLRVSLVTTLVTAWLVFLLYCYLTLTTVCSEVRLHCPAPGHTFPARACCSSLWLQLGAPVGLGNECSVDMAEMEAGCPMYSCYKNATTGELNVNGCTGVPNMLFNEAACNIHDLCYITPGASKRFCDDTFVENIVTAYCDNVNVLERLSCTGRAQLAGAVVSAIDSFYDDSAETRESCDLVSSWHTSLLVSVIVTLIIGVTMSFLPKSVIEDPVGDVQDKSATLDSKIEVIVEDEIERLDGSEELLVQEDTTKDNFNHVADHRKEDDEFGENVTKNLSECEESDDVLIKEYHVIDNAQSDETDNHNPEDPSQSSATYDTNKINRKQLNDEK